MVLIVERRDPAPLPDPLDPGPRSLERALRHMHWHFTASDASALMQRRPCPLPPPGGDLQLRAAATCARICAITEA